MAIRLRRPRAFKTFRDLEGKPIAERINVMRKNVLDMVALEEFVSVQEVKAVLCDLWVEWASG